VHCARHQIEWCDTAALVANPRNARKHSKKQLAQVARSIKNFGFINPIVVDGKNQVVAGHARLLAAKEIALVTVPVVRLLNLTENQVRAYMLADNRLAELSDWDEAELSLELAFLSELPEIDIPGFEIQESPKPKSATTKCKPEVRAKSGEAWQLGPHVLVCGDKDLEHADSLLVHFEARSAIKAVRCPARDVSPFNTGGSHA
jgi:hypothetical protein